MCPRVSTHWEVFERSILDAALRERLEPADVVYAWDVLHHTGDIWRAIRNAAGLVKRGGRFFIAIYNRLEYDSMTQCWSSHGWLKLRAREKTS